MNKPKSDDYMVWGRVGDSNFFAKLYSTSKRNAAVNWIKRNERYYKNMHIYPWGDDVEKRYNPNDDYDEIIERDKRCSELDCEEKAMRAVRLAQKAGGEN